MSAALTCPTCRGERALMWDHGEGSEPRWQCQSPWCHGGRRLPTLAEWDALEAERDRRIDPDDMEAVAHAAEKWGPPPEGIQWRTLLAERDRYREALEFIATSPNWKLTWREAVAKSINGRYRLCVERARAASDSDPDLAERTRRIRADE